MLFRRFSDPRACTAQDLQGEGSRRCAAVWHQPAGLSYALAIAVRKQDWMFWAVQQTLLFPLVILSGMLLPLDRGPAWMQAVGRINPLTSIVDASRALFSGSIVTASVLQGAIVAVIVAVTGLWLGARAMRRSTF